MFCYLLVNRELLETIGKCLCIEIFDDQGEEHNLMKT